MNRQDAPQPPGRRPVVVVRDLRRRDPVTLQPRARRRGGSRADAPPPPPGSVAGPAAPDTAPDTAGPDVAPGGAGPGAEPDPAAPGAEPDRAAPEAGPGAASADPLAERTADLQRLKAEYDNYRKRVQRDQLAVRQIAVVNVLQALLPVLDAVDKAREHGDITPALGVITGLLESQLAGLGLERVGTPGEPFDPTRHEALAHGTSPEVDRPTCTTVLRPGYRVGDHLLRPAEVTVTEPPAPARTG